MGEVVAFLVIVAILGALGYGSWSLAHRYLTQSGRRAARLKAIRRERQRLLRSMPECDDPLRRLYDLRLEALSIEEKHLEDEERVNELGRAS